MGSKGTFWNCVPTTLGATGLFCAKGVKLPAAAAACPLPLFLFSISGQVFVLNPWAKHKFNLKIRTVNVKNVKV